jgi:2,4-dienoyl-CoA reductase-like NADH-dependent reductase (Old Yellow Enzyme family)
MKDPVSTDIPTPKLFEPLKIRGITLPNRIALAPLCMYSATDGVANDWHFSHLSTFARGGVGLVFTEATGVEPRGRITPRCLGLWNDAQADALKPITAFIKSMGSVPGMQLAHAGRKASVRPPFLGGTPLNDEDAARGEPAWDVVGPSANGLGEPWPSPHALTATEIREIVAAFAAAAARSVAAGFEVLEVHGAHGYLIQSFLSPISNQRNDEYGGDLAGRMRFALEVAEAVRAAWPRHLPLFYRISAVDGPDDGWNMDDSVALSRELHARGVDVIDCSSGGVLGLPRFRGADDGKTLVKRIARGPGFQVPYAERVRRETDAMSMAVGVIIDPQQAEDILQQGRADIVAIGRELMYNPFWPLHAAQALGIDAEAERWPKQYAWAIKGRASLAEFNRPGS